MLRKFGFKRRQHPAIVRDVGATRSEVLECITFGRKFHRAVERVENPKKLRAHVAKWKRRLANIELPPPSVADIYQVKKDVKRDRMLIDGKLFTRHSKEDPAKFLAELIWKRAGQGEKPSRYEALAEKILMRSSRTVSGADTYFVCERLFARPGYFHLTPFQNGDPKPIRVEVDASGVVEIASTNYYKITTHCDEGQGLHIVEWLSLETVDVQVLDLCVKERRLEHKSRYVSVRDFDDAIPVERTAERTDLSDRTTEATNDSVIEEKRASDLADKPLVITIGNVLTTAQTSSADAEKESIGVDLESLRIEPPNISPKHKRSRSRSRSRSPASTCEDDDSKVYRKYNVNFDVGPLGFGFRWIPGVGAVVRALRPGGQAERSGRVRIGDSVHAVDGFPCIGDREAFRKRISSDRPRGRISVVFSRPESVHPPLPSAPKTV